MIRHAKTRRRKSCCRTVRMLREALSYLAFLPLALHASGITLCVLPIHTTEVSDTLRIGVHEAVLLALENSPTVAIQRAETAIMKTYVREEHAAFDPVLSVTGEKSEITSRRRLGTQPMPLELRDERFDMTAELTADLPTGASLSLTAGMTGSVSNLYTDQYTGTLGLTVTQSLLEGFGFVPNLARLRKARIDAEMSDAELKEVGQDVAASVEKRYWDLYLTQEEKEIQGRSLALAEQQLAESLERVKVGKLPELELASVEAEVAARRGALIDAQSRQQQARLQLLYLLSLDTASLWSIVPLLADRPFVPADTLDTIAVHERLGLDYRPDLTLARLELAKDEIEVSRTKNGLLPRLDVFISLGKTSYAESFQDAYPDPTSPHNQATAGLSFEFPVPNRKASARLSRASLSREQQELAVRNMERLVQLDIRSTYVEVLRARQQIEATRLTRVLQEKKLAAEQEKFRVGKSTNLLVLQAQRDLVASHLDEARAMAAYLEALIDLYVAEGTLLERRGITLARG